MWGSREEVIYGWPCWWTPRAWTHKVNGREALALWDFGPRSLPTPLARDPISLLQTVLVGSTGSAPSATCECLLQCWKTSTRLMYPVRDDLGPWLAGEAKFGPKFIQLKGQATLFTTEEGEDGKGLSCEWGQKAFCVVTHGRAGHGSETNLGHVCQRQNQRQDLMNAWVTAQSRGFVRGPLSCGPYPSPPELAVDESLWRGLEVAERNIKRSYRRQSFLDSSRAWK